jgi:hypothetical protein
MPRLAPPPGTVTRKQAVSALLREEVITSPSMMEKLKGIDRVVLAGRTHGFYYEQQILDIINARRAMRNQPPLKNIFEERHEIVCRQETPADMPGVYAVAEKLFGRTTASDARVPLIERVPEGNLVVTDRGKIVSFAHIQPLLPGPIGQFLRSEIVGNQITADHLDPFAPSKVVDVLIKSIGSYHESQAISTRYNKALFLGLKRELTRWGEKGYIIHRIYATSETPTGIESANEFHMHSLGKIRSRHKKKRFAYELDPLTTTNPFFRDYQAAIAHWQQQHPEEYAQAWRDWSERQQQAEEQKSA